MLEIIEPTKSLKDWEKYKSAINLIQNSGLSSDVRIAIDDIKNRFFNDQSLFLLAKVDNNVVGFIYSLPISDLPNDYKSKQLDSWKKDKQSIAYIDAAVILPKYQNMGIADKMLKILINKSKSIYLTAHAFNNVSKKVLEKNGFKEAFVDDEWFEEKKLSFMVLQ